MNLLRKTPVSAFALLLGTLLVGCSGFITSRIDDHTWKHGPFQISLVDESGRDGAWLGGKNLTIRHTPGQERFVLWGHQNPLQSDPVLNQTEVRCPQGVLLIEVLKMPGVDGEPKMKMVDSESPEGTLLTTLSFGDGETFFSYRLRNSGGCSSTPSEHMQPSAH